MIDIILTKFFDIDLIDIKAVIELLIRFSFNILVTLIIAKFFYYAKTKRTDYFFSYVILGSSIFLLIFLLESVKLKIGFAIGLFAIFGIIRYRTNPIPIKEMTYLFIIITVSVINGLTTKKISYSELIISNLLIVLVIYLLEKIWFVRQEKSKKIIYEKIELIKPEKKEELIKDIENRTGIKINRIEVGQIDFLKDVAKIKIYFYDKNQYNFSEEENY